MAQCPGHRFIVQLRVGISTCACGPECHGREGCRRSDIWPLGTAALARTAMCARARMHESRLISQSCSRPRINLSKWLRSRCRRNKSSAFRASSLRRLVFSRLSRLSQSLLSIERSEFGHDRVWILMHECIRIATAARLINARRED